MTMAEPFLNCGKCLYNVNVVNFNPHSKIEGMIGTEVE